MMVLRLTLDELLWKNLAVQGYSWRIELAFFPFGYSAGFILSVWSGQRFWLPVFFCGATALNALVYGLLGAVAFYGPRRFRAGPYAAVILILSYWIFVFNFA
jgi:hypothetical protein